MATNIRFESELLYKITQVAKQNKRSLKAQLYFQEQKRVKKFENENGKTEPDENEI